MPAADQGPQETPKREPTQHRRWIVAAFWGSLALMLAAVGILVLQGCGIRLFGRTFLDFCTKEEVVDLRPPPELAQEETRARVLRDRLAKLQVELAYVEACPLPPVVEVEPEPEPPKPEPPKPEPPKPEPPKPEPPKPDPGPKTPEKACREVPPEERKIDVYLLFDLSGSFRDDLPAMRSMMQGLVGLKSAGRLEGQLRLGVGSFIDKPFDPFAFPGAHTYKHHASLTEDLASILRTVRGLRVEEGGDEPESQLEALLETAGNAGRIGFADDAARIVVVVTDASYHEAGDWRRGAAEDGRADGNPSNEDYPSVAQVRSALQAAGLTPIFLVQGRKELSLYRNLASQLGGGKVVPLQSDSADLLAALDTGIAEICGEGLSR